MISTHCVTQLDLYDLPITPLMDKMSQSLAVQQCDWEDRPPLGAEAPTQTLPKPEMTPKDPHTVEQAMLTSFSSLQSMGEGIGRVGNRLFEKAIHFGEIDLSEKVPWKSMFQNGIYKRSCLTTVQAMMSAFYKTASSAPKLIKNAYCNANVMTTVVDGIGSKKNGNLVVDPDKSQQVLKTIDAYLESGLPVPVLVAYRGRRGGSATNHWCLIVGKQFHNGQWEYTMHDPGTFENHHNKPSENSQYTKDHFIFRHNPNSGQIEAKAVGQKIYQIYGIARYEGFTRPDGLQVAGTVSS